MQVPVTYTLTTADGDLDLAGATLARGDETFRASSRDARVSLSDTLDLAPGGPGAAPTDATGVTVDAWFEGAELTLLLLRWVGGRKAGEIALEHPVESR